MPRSWTGTLHCCLYTVLLHNSSSTNFLLLHCLLLACCVCCEESSHRTNGSKLRKKKLEKHSKNRKPCNLIFKKSVGNFENMVKRKFLKLKKICFKSTGGKVSYVHDCCFSIFVVWVYTWVFNLSNSFELHCSYRSSEEPGAVQYTVWLLLFSVDELS